MSNSVEVFDSVHCQSVLDWIANVLDPSKSSDEVREGLDSTIRNLGRRKGMSPAERENLIFETCERVAARLESPGDARIEFESRRDNDAGAVPVRYGSPDPVSVAVVVPGGDTASHEVQLVACDGGRSTEPVALEFSGFSPQLGSAAVKLFAGQFKSGIDYELRVVESASGRVVWSRPVRRQTVYPVRFPGSKSARLLFANAPEPMPERCLLREASGEGSVQLPVSAGDPPSAILLLASCRSEATYELSFACPGSGQEFVSLIRPYDFATQEQRVSFVLQTAKNILRELHAETPEPVEKVPDWYEQPPSQEEFSWPVRECILKRGCCQERGAGSCRLSGRDQSLLDAVYRDATPLAVLAKRRATRRAELEAGVAAVRRDLGEARFLTLLHYFYHLRAGEISALIGSRVSESDLMDAPRGLPLHRGIIVWIFVAQLERQDVARYLGVDPALVRQWLLRERGKLTGCLEHRKVWFRGNRKVLP